MAALSLHCPKEEELLLVLLPAVNIVLWSTPWAWIPKPRLGASRQDVVTT